MYISEKLMISPKLLLRLFWFQNMFITHEQRKSLEIYHLYFSINSQRLQPLSLIYQARTKSDIITISFQVCSPESDHYADTHWSQGLVSAVRQTFPLEPTT